MILKCCCWIMLLLGVAGCQRELAKSTNDRANSRAIKDLLAINDDTLMAVKWYGGLLLTTDGGEIWTELGNDLIVNQIMIDSQGVLWGLQSWIGIHEEDQARLAHSTDEGRTWSIKVLDTKTFFPYKIVSSPHRPLRVLTVQHEVFELTGKDAKWNPVSGNHLRAQEPRAIYLHDVSLTRDGFLLKHRGQVVVDTLLRLKPQSIPIDLLASRDRLYVVASNNGNGYLATLYRDSVIWEKEIEGQFSGVTEDSKGRIWYYGSPGVFLKSDDVLRRKY